MSDQEARMIEHLLKESGVEHEIMQHEPVFTSDAVAKVRGVELRTGVKALVLKTPDKRFMMALCPGDKRLDLKQIAKLVGVKKVSLASPEEVLEITGCEVGSVPPFGHPRKLPTYMDKDVLKNEWVNFNIGSHTKSAKMRSSDLNRLIEPVLI